MPAPDPVVIISDQVNADNEVIDKIISVTEFVEKTRTISLNELQQRRSILQSELAELDELIAEATK